MARADFDSVCATRTLCVMSSPDAKKLRIYVLRSLNNVNIQEMPWSQMAIILLTRLQSNAIQSTSTDLLYIATLWHLDEITTNQDRRI